jgi:phage-related protein
MATFIEELIARLALDTDEQSFKKGERGMDDLAKSAVKMGAVIGASISAVKTAIGAMVVNFANEADETNKLARRIGTTAEVIQEFDYVAERSGVSVNLMRNSLEKLNAKASQAATGSAEMANTFQELGISADQFAKASPDEKFDQIAKAMAGLPSDADRTRIAMKLFEEEGRSMVTVFEGGAGAIAAMRQEARDLGLFSSEDAAVAETFNDRMLDVGRAMRGIRNIVGASLLPTLTEALEGFVEFFKQNREIISSSLVAFFKGAAIALKGLAYAAGIFVAFKLGMAVIATAKGVMLLTAAFKAARIGALLMNAAVLAIPILIGLAVAAVALLAEDLYTFFQGGESYIGDFVKQWPLLGTAINGVADVLKFAWEYAKDMFDVLWSIVTLDFSGLADAMGRVVDKWKTVLSAFFNWVADNTPDILKDAIGAVGGAISATADTVSGAASAVADFVSSPFAEGGIFGGPAPMIAPAVASQAVSNSSSRTMQDNRQYNITGTDIGEVKRVLNEKNAFAAKTIDTGVEY